MVPDEHTGPSLVTDANHPASVFQSFCNWLLDQGMHRMAGTRLGHHSMHPVGSGDDHPLDRFILQQLFDVRVERNPELTGDGRVAVVDITQADQQTVIVFRDELRVFSANPPEPRNGQSHRFHFVQPNCVRLLTRLQESAPATTPRAVTGRRETPGDAGSLPITLTRNGLRPGFQQSVARSPTATPRP